jgi:hypothetical protein
MPITSSNDLILAGIHDIVDALEHPSSGSPLVPLATSHVAALHQLMTEVLTSVTAPAPTSSQPTIAPPPSPSVAPLRVLKPLVTSAPPTAPLRVNDCGATPTPKKYTNTMFFIDPPKFPKAANQRICVSSARIGPKKTIRNVFVGLVAVT